MDGQGDDDDSDENNKCRTTNTVSSGMHTIQNIVAPPEPMPSTSSQSIAAVVSNNQISHFPNEMRIKQEPGVETVPVAIPIPVPTQCDKPIATNEQIHSIEHNYPSILTTPIKIEQPSISHQIIAGPSKQISTICNQNYANLLNAGSNVSAINPVVAAQPKAATPKRFIKCVSKDGKISLMELVQDESNPKVFKMVLPKGVGTNRVNLQQQQQQQPQAMNTMKLVKPLGTALMQPIKIGTMLASSSSGKMPLIRNLTGNSMNSISNNANTPITNLNLTTINSISAIPKATQLVPNSNIVVVPKPSISLPKLVAINSPKSTTPPTNKASLSAQQFPPGTRIIKNNNKILVLDSNQLQKAQRQKQSLLKPQVSLLKPRPTTSIGSSVKRITVTNIPGIEHKNINVFVPNDMGMATKSVFKAKSTLTMRQNFSKLLENRFMARRTFSNMTEAIAWLMKAIPLVSSTAAHPEFRESFPFVVSTMAEFYSFHVAKQRNFEVIFFLAQSQMIVVEIR